MTNLTQVIQQIREQHRRLMVSSKDDYINELIKVNDLQLQLAQCLADLDATVKSAKRDADHAVMLAHRAERGH